MLGTIVVVVARAGVWTPWYVLRTLARARGVAESAEAAEAPSAGPEAGVTNE